MGGALLVGWLCGGWGSGAGSMGFGHVGWTGGLFQEWMLRNSVLRQRRCLSHFNGIVRKVRWSFPHPASLSLVVLELLDFRVHLSLYPYVFLE